MVSICLIVWLIEAKNSQKRWVEKTRLVESRGTVQDIEFAHRDQGLKLVWIYSKLRAVWQLMQKSVSLIIVNHSYCPIFRQPAGPTAWFVSTKPRGSTTLRNGHKCGSLKFAPRCRPSTVVLVVPHPWLLRRVRRRVEALSQWRIRTAITVCHGILANPRRPRRRWWW